MSQSQSLLAKIAEKNDLTQLKQETAQTQETQVVKTSFSDKITQIITSKMTFAEDYQKHKANQIILQLLAKISENPKVFELFTSQNNLHNSIRIVTQLINLDLPFSSDMYYVIPYKNDLSLQISYKGLLEIAYRAGVYNVIVNLVYEGDEFDFYYSNKNYFKHKPNFKSKNPTFYYATCKVFKKDETDDLMLSVASHEEMIDFKKRFSKKNKDGSPSIWDLNFDEMAKKTVLKRLLKFCPKTNLNTLQDIEEESE